MLDYRYIAGLIDGEGCIQVQKRNEPELKYPAYKFFVQVSMTHEGVIAALKQSCGGSYSPIHWHTRRNNRTAYQWRIHGALANELLKTITPYLIVKKQEALLAMQFHESMVQWTNKLRHQPDEVKQAVWEWREAAYLQMRALKKVSGALDGMDANSEKTRCPVSDDAEGQPRTKQAGLKLAGRA